jgi:hypothetical protein
MKQIGPDNIPPPLPDSVLAAVADAAQDPVRRLLFILAALHARRPFQMRQILLADIDLEQRQLTIDGRVRALDPITYDTVIDYLKYRRARWPVCPNPHLLVSKQTGYETGPGQQRLDKRPVPRTAHHPRPHPNGPLPRRTAHARSRPATLPSRLRRQPGNRSPLRDRRRSASGNHDRRSPQAILTIAADYPVRWLFRPEQLVVKVVQCWSGWLDPRLRQPNDGRACGGAFAAHA